MKIDKISLDGKKNSIDVSENIFFAKINKKNISNVIFKQFSNYKGRKAKTKQKNEIKGSTSKIYAQKGTGNARHASRKAPIFVGGGVAHGPKGENNYRTKKLNKSEKKLSIRSLISEKNLNKDLIIMEDFNAEINKTKEFFKILKNLNALHSLLVFDKSSRNMINKSSRNLKNVKLTDINHFSSYDIAKYKKLILTETSVKEIEKKFL
tara:strand:+ start:1164 stop:1787 length:624 start_codon:yes stop_codon:yes gene_type:complete